MADVATCPNVVLKVGGIGMPMYGSATWHKRDAPVPPDADEVVAEWAEPVRFCIDTFGPDRCMFESNFPVDRISMSYATLWEAFDVMSAELLRHRARRPVPRHRRPHLPTRRARPRPEHR